MVARYDDMVNKDFPIFHNIFCQNKFFSRLTLAVMLGSMGLPWWPLRMTHLTRRMPNQSSRSLKMILMTSLTTSPLNRATMRPYETHVPAFQICQNLYLLDHMIWYLLTVTFEISRFIFSDE